MLIVGESVSRDFFIAYLANGNAVVYADQQAVGLVLTNGGVYKRITLQRGGKWVVILNDPLDRKIDQAISELVSRYKAGTERSRSANHPGIEWKETELCDNTTWAVLEDMAQAPGVKPPLPTYRVAAPASVPE